MVLCEDAKATDQGVDSLLVSQVRERFDVGLELVILIAHVHPLVLHDAL